MSKVNQTHWYHPRIFNQKLIYWRLHLYTYSLGHLLQPISRIHAGMFMNIHDLIAKDVEWRSNCEDGKATYLKVYWKRDIEALTFRQFYGKILRISINSVQERSRRVSPPMPISFRVILNINKVNFRWYLGESGVDNPCNRHVFHCLYYRLY